MFNSDKQREKAAAKQKVRDKIKAEFDRSKYRYIPEEKPLNYVDNNITQTVGIYVRVSTDDDPSEVPIDEEEIQIEVQAGDFDLRGFEIARSEFFETTRSPNVCFNHKQLKFSTACVRKFEKNSYVELLINPISRKFAIRPTTKDNRNAVEFSKPQAGKMFPKEIPCAAFGDTIYFLFGWNIDYKYRILGSLYEQDGEIAYIFDIKDGQIIQALTRNGQRKIK